MESENNKLNILIPIMEFGKSGGLRVLSQLANNWTSLGCNVTIIAYYKSDYPYYDTKAKIVWIDDKGNPTNNNPMKSNGGGVYKISYSIYKYLKKHSQEYDVILGNYNITTIPIFLASKSNNFYYIQAYEPGFYDNNYGLKNRLLKFIAWITYFLPLTKVVNAELYKSYKNIKSNYVIPPGLDLKNYYPKILDNKRKGSLIVGCIGRSEEWKGSNDVGEAVKILHDKGLNIKLKVAFNPVNYTNHELVKPDGDKNLADYYRSLDVLVAPGHIQLGAIHYPVIEAMACNVPVITTGYYPANEENSFIVPIKSPNEIANVLEKIYYNYSIAIEKANIAKKDILQFDWNIISENFINIFKSEIK